MSEMASPSLPSTQIAITAASPGVLQISRSHALPKLLPGTMLVKVHAVAINPSDAKMVDYSFVQDAISGYDLAGVVVAIHPDPIKHTATDNANGSTSPPTNESAEQPPPRSKWQIGDRIWAGVHGMNRADPTNGAFAEYARVDQRLAIRMPDDMPFEEAAGLSTSFTTAALMLWRSLKVDEKGLGGKIIPHGDRFENVNKGEFILIYGGSSSTGTMALQLAKIAGLRPLATSSPHNIALCKRYGAEAVFPHTSSTSAADIHAYTANTLRFALDCITLDTSMALCYAAIGRAGGAYAAVEPYPARHKTRKAIRDDWVMALTVHGEAVLLDGVYGRTAEVGRADYEWATGEGGLFERAEGWVREGRVRGHPVEKVGGGWEGVLEAVGRIKRGGVSGKKLVCVVA